MRLLGVRAGFLATMALVAGSVSLSAQTTAQSSVACDRQCLLSVMDAFVKALTSGRPESVPLVEHPEVRENAVGVALGNTTWARVKRVRSMVTIADPLSANVVSRSGVELSTGDPGYLSTRLRVVAGRISDVEMSADTSPRVVRSYVWNLDPLLTSELPPEQRMSRVDLEALARRYFHSLSTHQAIAADFDDRCNRYHSGQQITNVGNNSVEGAPPRTCAGSLQGAPPWGPATEQRFPVIDVERGLVFGIFKTPTPSQMYVSEVFKVVGGRIVRIDNIGLLMRGITSLGFVH